METPFTAGKTNLLKVARIHSHGAYLEINENDAVLLPTKWMPENCSVGDEIEVFIYFDSNDQIIATTMKPFAQVNEVALLRAVDVNNYGAFLDWGLEKDILVPYREQKVSMTTGRSYLVYIYSDEQSGRIAASAKIEQFIDIEPITYEEGQEVNIIIWDKTDLGFKAIIEHKHQGLIYANEVFQRLDRGQKLKAFVSKIREDGKIDLRLQPSGYEKMDEFATKIMAKLNSSDGFMALTDHSPAEDIYETLQMSKKNFKKAVGLLYKQHIILIENDGIRLNKN